jgi:hypothetical protein
VGVEDPQYPVGRAADGYLILGLPFLAAPIAAVFAELMYRAGLRGLTLASAALTLTSALIWLVCRWGGRSNARSLAYAVLTLVVLVALTTLFLLAVAGDS